MLILMFHSLVKLPPIDELDKVLGTDKWRVKKDGEQNPFEALDKKFKPMKGRRAVPTRQINGIAAQQGTPQPILVGGERGSSGMDW